MSNNSFHSLKAKGRQRPSEYSPKRIRTGAQKLNQALPYWLRDWGIILHVLSAYLIFQKTKPTNFISQLVNVLLLRVNLKSGSVLCQDLIWFITIRPFGNHRRSISIMLEFLLWRLEIAVGFIY